MTPAIEIGPANLRDASWILAHMRKADQAEVEALAPTEWSNVGVAGLLVSPGASWIAYLRDDPVFLFGFAPISYAGNVLSAWGLGTDRAGRVIPAVNRWVVEELVDDWIGRGVTRVEARTMVENALAARWLVAAGARSEGTNRRFGRSGELFEMFAWTTKPALRRR